MKTTVRLFVILFTLFGNKIAGQQELRWVEGAYGPDNEFPRHSVTNTVGTTYVTGTFTGSLSFNSDSGTVTINGLGERDIYLASYDSAGTFKWVRQIAGTGEDFVDRMHLDPFGNVLIAGRFTDSLYPALPSKLGALAAGTQTHGLVGKYSPQGNLIWARQLAGSLVQAHDVTADINACYITGEYNSTVDLDPGAGVQSYTTKGQADIFVCSLDNLGNHRWSLSMGGTGFDRGDCLADYGAFLYVAGRFDNFMDFDPGPGVNEWYSKSGGRDVFLLKITTQNGMYMDHGIVGGSSVEEVVDIATSSTAIWFAGEFGGTCDFDPQQGEIFETFEGGQDIFALKTDLDLEYKHVGLLSGPANEYVRSIVCDADDNVWIGGYYEVTIDTDPSEYVVMGPSLGGLDFIVARWSSGGDHLCTRVGGGKGDDGIAGLGLDAFGNYYLHGFYGGNFTGETDFTRTAFPVKLSSSGDRELFTASYRQCQSMVGLSDYETKSIKVFPNPARDNISIDGLQTPAVLYLFDTRGSLARTFYLRDSSSPLNLDDLPPGLYNLKVGDGVSAVSTRVVVW